MKSSQPVLGISLFGNNFPCSRVYVHFSILLQECMSSRDSQLNIGWSSRNPKEEEEEGS